MPTLSLSAKQTTEVVRMTWSRWAVLRSLLCAAILILGAVWAGTAHADDGAWKAANDTDPHVPLTPFQEQMKAEKEAAVADYFTTISGLATTDLTADGSPLVPNAALAAAPTSASLLANQQPQQTSYWCGPAAVAEALGQMGVSISQSTAAKKLGTTTDGTAWSGGATSTGHPVPDVLNLYQSRNYYIPWSVPTTPSSTDIANYKTFLVSNIVNPPAVPLVGNAYETRSSHYHLNGHPGDRTIFHWFDIRGYTSNGGSTMYEDSVHNATTVSWYQSVPAYSTQPSNEIVTITGGRGYVW
jgi:Peptidase_C39 like family